MQSTEPLLQELLRQVQQHHQSCCRRAGQEEERRGRADTEMNAEIDAKISKVVQQYEDMVQELALVEKHLLQAQARALTEEERRLADRKQALCGYHNLINLPSSDGESPLGSYLDRGLLEKKGLLHPAHYLPGHPPHTNLQPPPEEAPTYLLPTFTYTQHTATSQHSSTGEIQRLLKWKDRSLSPAVQETGTRTLARPRRQQRAGSHLRSSSSFCPLPTSGPASSSSSGAVRRRTSRDPGKNDFSSSRDVQLFAAEPNQVVFTDYQVGHTYQMSVDIRNVSGSSRKMRLVPLNSPYFTVTRGASNQYEGLIAPGMHVTCTVTFTPPSLCNYQEEIKVQSHNDYSLTIPVSAVRPAPCLSLPEVIECGSCLAGGRREVELEVNNSGGEGRFSLQHTAAHHQQHQSPTESEGVLILGPFTVSPTEFHLPPLTSTTLQVAFSPASEGRYGEHFVIECDNGETISFGLTGSGDVVSVGCVYIGDSSLQEISQFTTSSDSSDEDRSNQRGVDPVISAIDYDLYMEQLEEASVAFDVVNPHSPAYKTVVIRNYSGVDLPFSWRLFRPLTELSSSNEGEDPVIDDLVPSHNSPFSVLPSSGTLPAATSHTFLCQFLPHKPGQYLDAGHLVLSGVPRPSLDLSLEGERWRRVQGEEGEVSSVCLFLSGVAQPCALELEPPALLIPVPIPLATDIRRRIKLVNRSVSRLNYCWREPLPDEGITISPLSGSLVGGGGGYCEVVIKRTVEGEFSLNLICDIEHSPHPVSLPLHGWTQGPQVSVDCPSLDFGLVPLGTSSTLTLTLTSHTHTPLPILLRQAVGSQATSSSSSSSSSSGTSSSSDSQTVTDHDCLHFSPSSLTLPPHTVTTLTVECRPLVTGRLRSIVQCLVDDKVIRCVEVHAEVQSPRVVLNECVIHQDTAYVGVGCENRVQMTNTSLIPTHFSWRQQVEGESGASCSVSISPVSGSIGPRQSLPITLTATWDSTGSHPETILCCDVEGMRESLLLGLSAEVHGLAVSYSVQDNLSLDEEEPSLEFGSEVSLFTPHTLHLLVTNTTAIPSTLSTSLTNFPPSTPPLLTPPSLTSKKSQKKSLLSRTVNIGDPKSKTAQQSNKDYMSGLLREGRGCCFVVDPPTLPLLPFTTHTLTITAYADMWGDYRDTLKCQVSGLEAAEVPIHCRVTGCPLVFHSTALPQRSLVRFGSHLANGPPAQRAIRINNTGPQEVRVDWQMFRRVSQEEEGGQLVDLITTIGTPFPKHTPSSPPHQHHCVTSPHPHSSQLSHNKPPPAVPCGLTPEPEQQGQGGTECRLSGDGMESGDGTEPGQRGDEGEGGSQAIEKLESDPVVCVFLRGHEGVPSHRPFSVYPEQMVVPARGHSLFTVEFDPSLVGDAVVNQFAYCLGYISLDTQMGLYPHSCEGVVRSTDYHLTPLRLDLEASLEVPTLHLEEDSEAGLYFSYPASILLHREHVLSSVSKTHHVTYVNLTSSSLSFTLSSSSPRFTLTPSPPSSHTPSSHVGHTLTPNTGLSVSVMFRVYQEDLRDCREDKISFSDTLLVQFSTGATQEFPLRGEVSIPHMSLSTQTLELGPCLLGHSLSSPLTLYNTSPLPLPWTIQPAAGGLCDVVGVSPSSGVLPPHVGTTGPSQQHILLTFTPQTESEYTGIVVVRESLTGCETHVALTASTTADEIHSPIDLMHLL